MKNVLFNDYFLLIAFFKLFKATKSLDYVINRKVTFEIEHNQMKISPVDPL